MRRFYLLAIPLLFLTACTTANPATLTVPGSTVTPNPNASATLTPFGPSADTPTAPPPTPTLTLSPTLTLTPGPAPDFAPSTSTSTSTSTYTLSVLMDYAAHSLTVDETISYQNSTGVNLTSLVLAVEPNMWKGCYLPGSLTVNGQAVDEVDLNGIRLEVPLAAPLAPNETLVLFLHYDLHLPPADLYHLFGYKVLQTNLVDWYPFVVPYVPGQGWMLHSPANVGEYLVYDEAAFDVTLHLTDPGVATVIAASAPAEKISDGWHYHLEKARSFVFSISTEYQTASTTANGVAVTSYFFNDDEAQGRVVLENVAKALTTYSELFGPDPYPSLSIVESPYFDGMEYDGLFFLNRDYYTAEDGTVLNNLVDIAVHETAHQWWFGAVGNDQALEPWLDEALATYSERLFYEQNYPSVTAWQNFRIDSFSPSGWVDTDIYHSGNIRTYANAVYLRGAQFLQALRERIGDEAFFAFLKDYATQMSGQRATAMDFFHILRQHTSADISDILSMYFQSPH